MENLKREIWENWTPQDFIDVLSDEIDMIMTGVALQKPFKTTKEMFDYIRNNQPYYKKTIPEVNAYFAKRYNLEFP